MFGLDLRTLRVVWTAFLFVLIVALLYRLSSTIVVFTLAIFLAHLLGPIATRLEWALPAKWVQRRVSLVIVYLALVAAVIAVLVPLLSQVGEQAAALAKQLPSAFDNDPLAKFPLPGWLEPLRERLTTSLHDWFSGLDKQLVPMLEGLGTSIGGVLGGALAIVLIPILSFFFLKDGHDLQSAFVAFVPTQYQAITHDILQDLHRLLILYLRALVLLALIVLVVYTAFLSAAGVPFAALLAVISALLEIIPVAGPLAASVIILLTALISGYEHLGLLLLFLVAFRLVQDYLVSPQLLAKGVEIHPVWVLFGVLAGEELAGIPGMFFSVPVMAALRIVVMRMRRNTLATDALVK